MLLPLSQANTALTSTCYSTKVLDLWLIRHGETAWNAARRIQGQTDVPLNERGIRQAKRLAERFSIQTFDAVYTSDSERAHHTAKLVVGERPIRVDKRLREVHFGTLEGKTRPELSEAERDALLMYRTGNGSERLPGGESQNDVRERVKAWLETLPTSGHIAAFSHGGTIRTLLFSILEVPQSERWHFVFGNTSVTKVRFGPVRFGSGRTLIQSVGDTSHLETMTEELHA